MKIKIKKILLVFFSISIGIVIGSYITFQRTQRDISMSFINSFLYDLNIEMDLLEHWNSNYKNDSIMEKKIKHLILNKLIAMYEVNPRIDNLKGVPLEALQRLIIFSKENSINIEKYNNSFNIAFSYLKSVENDVNQLMEKRKEIHKKPFK